MYDDDTDSWYWTLEVINPDLGAGAFIQSGDDFQPLFEAAVHRYDVMTGS